MQDPFLKVLFYMNNSLNSLKDKILLLFCFIDEKTKSQIG